MAELSSIQSKMRSPTSGPAIHKQSPKNEQGTHQVVLSPAQTYNMHQDTLFVTKVIAVLSQIPLVTAFERCLRALLDLVVNNPSEVDLPLESYVYNLIYEVPLLPPGNSLRFSVGRHDIICQRPGNQCVTRCLDIGTFFTKPIA